VRRASPLLLFACACGVNEEALRAADDQVSRRLAERVEIARDLSDTRRQLDLIEQKWTALGVPLPPLAPEPPVVLPPRSRFEGAEAERLRIRIAENEARVRELDKVIGEVGRINERRRQLEERLNSAPPR
jgi:hypothetical protein